MSLVPSVKHPRPTQAYPRRRPEHDTPNYHIENTVTSLHQRDAFALL